MNNFGLSINDSVIGKMAEMAALEVEGVASMGVKPASLKNILGKIGGTKSVNVYSENDVINVDIYIKVNDSKKVTEVAEKVQSGVKEKLQGMTGSAVTRVNVVVSDIKFSDETEN